MEGKDGNGTVRKGDRDQNLIEFDSLFTHSPFKHSQCLLTPGACFTLPHWNAMFGDSLALHIVGPTNEEKLEERKG